MSFTSEIADFLETSGGLQKVDFFIGSGNRIHVSGAGFQRVGKHIRDGRVEVEVNDARLAAEKAGAYYDWNQNKMILPSYMEAGESAWCDFSDTWLNKSLVAHEAVHVQLDADKRKVLSLRNEAAAYLAQVVFAIQIVDECKLEKPIHQAALQVAKQYELTSRLGVRLTGKQIRPLAEALQESPLYGQGWLERDMDLDGV